MKGRFISIEGGEGAGKSTVIKLVREWLHERGYQVDLTREPGGTPMAEEIRQVMLAPRDETVDNLTELLLVFAARRQHVMARVLPKLQQGEWVVSDRFLDSSYVYQGLGRGIDTRTIDMLASLTVGDTLPDLTLLLDVPVDIGMERVRSRGAKDRLDGEALHFHEQVRRGFLQRAEQDPSRISVIDASGTLESVLEQVRVTLEQRLFSGDQ
ncbi:dTMP kinase [Maribrevibacterium harenarium]|uniref:Thymidylate kinase n=1 Tax=Maribrevibacterium harenarium TaxID=2589817 RepID=A0A501WJQ1_9GAMM|nr:dTMP kinase [Maribrevibacterium harenarium]TPE47261.1 dTMP kinase [Maribrevibacterium harenarium]